MESSTPEKSIFRVTSPAGENCGKDISAPVVKLSNGREYSWVKRLEEISA
jgi:hypothetical protein